MDITGSYTFNASSDRVWDLLMNPDVIASCIPGCDRFEPDGIVLRLTTVSPEPLCTRFEGAASAS